MLCNLMRKNRILALCNIDASGVMSKFKIIDSSNYLPLAYRYQPSSIIKWWNDRSIPVTREKIQDMLIEKKLIDTKHYLVNNLGLSLTDHYWIRPVDSDLS